MQFAPHLTNNLNPRPTAPGYQTAIVVGPDDSTTASEANELHCDALGRIKVKLYFLQDHGPTCGVERSIRRTYSRSVP